MIKEVSVVVSHRVETTQVTSPWASAATVPSQSQGQDVIVVVVQVVVVVVVSSIVLLDVGVSP